MRRMTLLAAAFLGFGLMGSGCNVASRIGSEVHSFFLDVNTTILGIDYPNGAPESKRQKYYGIPEPKDIAVNDD